MTTFTIVHVVLSLAGIISGFVVVSGLIAAQRLDRWTLLFLATTAATSLTGFGFPFEHVLPSHVVGAISLLVLVVARVTFVSWLAPGAGCTWSALSSPST